MMRKEHYIFLVFMVAAAVVCGYTLAFASCYKTIISENPPAGIIASEKAQQPSQNPKPQESESTAATQLASANSETEMMIVSQDEQQEIEEMLRTLGMQEGQDLEEFLIDFQKEQNLEPTGNLDSITLNTVITQTTLQKAIQRMNNS